MLGQFLKAIDIKEINKQNGPNQTYELLHSKGNNGKKKRQPKNAKIYLQMLW